MSDIDWEKLQTLFHQAQEVPDDELDAFLNQACVDQPELKTEVLKLLKASNTDSADFTEQIAQTSQQILTQYHQGTRIGPYKIIKELGQGGMGSVFLAQRDDDQFDQQVAIKLISGSHKSDTLAQRFVAERQILAGLKHPNIALLLDGGTTESGEPYFAMEYLQGQNIIKYCDNQNLDIKQRIKLFIEVCQAVSYAHGQLVLHRDIKPSNILISDSGQAKLLDFGIAKILKTGELNLQVTAREQMIMTPEYASPEQVLGQGMSVASDVYQLGLVLYQLLTGQQAVQLSDASVAEVKSKVVDEYPLSPSQRMSQTDRHNTQSSAEIANNRSTQPASLMKKLKGDLDIIVLKCLNKEPAQRYHAVNELEADLSAYLELRPIKARKLSIGYRLNRYLRRHWLVISTSMLAVLALLGGLTFALISLEQTKQAELRANSEAQAAEQISEFLIDMITNADPRESGGEEITVKQILNHSAEKVNQLNDQPEVKTKLLMVMGSSYVGLGEYDEGYRLLNQSVLLAKQTYPLDNHLLVNSLVARSSALNHQGKLKDAISDAQLAVDLARESKHITPHLLTELAGYLFVDGQYEEAQSLLIESLSIFDNSDKNNIHRKIEILHNLGLIGIEQLNFDQANKHLEEASDLLQLIPNNLNLRQINTYHTGVLFSTFYQYSDAEKQLKESLQLSREIFGNQHDRTVAVLSALGELQTRMFKFKAADQSLSEALKINTQIGHIENYYQLHLLQKYGNLKYHQGKFDQAAKIIQDAIIIAHKIHGENHLQSNTTKTYILKPLYAQGLFNEVITTAEQILDNLNQYFPPNHGFILFTKSYLGLAQAHNAGFKTAEIIAEELLASKNDRFTFFGLEIKFTINQLKGNIHANRNVILELKQNFEKQKANGRLDQEVDFLKLLIKHQMSLGTHDSILGHIDNIEDILLKKYGANHPEHLKNSFSRAQYLLTSNQESKATELTKSVFTQWIKPQDNSSVNTAYFAIEYANFLIYLKHTQQAIHILNQHLPTLKKFNEPVSHQLAYAQCLLGQALIQEGEATKGKVMVKEALKGLVSQLGKNSPLVKRCEF